MLRLRKVELFGFKSFTRRTQITFGGTGIAAIVGPNGCGKSNIADAILWVLGEQSPRTLRSGRMADCIFNGTATEAPTNLAEVTLTLVDPLAAAAPTPPPAEPPATNEGTADAGPKRRKNRLNLKIHPGEVVVTRRLYRSGESEYYLNGELCRLRDIQELFMGTGLGPESYAIIEQGRIGQILSSRPADRRAIIEEAAGVSKYKTKRRLAEAKLESARQNLLRLNDIFEEVTKQLNSLKRQASRARRYQELRAEAQQLRRRLLASRAELLQASQAQLAAELERTAKELESLAGTLAALEQAQEQDRARAIALETALRQQQNRAGQLVLDLERAQTRLAEVRRQQAELGRQRQECQQQQERLTAQLQQNAAAAAAAAAALNQLDLELEATRTAVQSQQAEQAALADRIRTQEEQLEEWQREQAASLNELASVRTELTQLREAAPAAAEALRRLTSQRETAAREKARLQEQQLHLQAAAEQVRQEVLRAQEELRAAEHALAEAQQEYRRQSAGLEELRQSLAGVAAQEQVLAELLEQRTLLAEPVQTLLTVNGDAAARDFRTVGVVADFVDLDPHYAPLLEEYLHDELQYVVVETYEAARSGVQLLRERATGRATFLVDSFGRRPLEAGTWKLSDAEAAALQPGNGVVSPLADLVRFNGPLGQEAARVLPRLSRTFLVQSPQVAEEMARRHPQLFFLSPEGTWYHGRLVSGGTRNGNGHGPASLKVEWESVAAKKTELLPAVNSLTVSLRAAEEAVAERDRQRAALRQSLFEREKTLLQCEQQLQARAAEYARWEQEEERAATELATHTGEQSGVERRLLELTRRQEELAAQDSQLATSLEALRAGLQQARQEATRTATQLTEQSARLAALEERRVALQQEQARLASEHAERLGEFSRQEELEEQFRRQQAEAAEAIVRAESAVHQQEDERRAAEAAGEQLEAELNGLRQQLGESEDRLRSARADLEGCRERQHALQVDRARLEADRDYLEAACQSEFGLTGAALMESCPERIPPEALEAAEEEYHQLKQKLENLGPVNMVALEEFQECEQRHAFLARQRDDLMASIADTTQAIQEIDAVSSQQFEEAFTVINQNFAESFRTLFGGGSAAMRLTDTENPGESGIDLVCQPPGKRLQNVLLLSGGEKALAALALLIAIFRYRPSPFCILDEVDAPLDEANVGRFTHLVQEMSSQTQFILVTHNKKTMEIAPVLYGVTMQNGISQLVSVRFEETVSTAA